MSKFFQRKLVVAVVASVVASSAWAQIDEAPQEPPYVQEEDNSELDAFFDLPTQTPSESSEAISNSAPVAEELDFEDDIQQADSLPATNEDIFSQDPVPAPTYTAPVVVEENKVRRHDPRSAKGRVEYIEHPLAEKGLIAITKEGAYIYRTEQSSAYKNTGVVRFGMMDPPKIVAQDGTTFEMMYSPGQQPVVFFDYEWKPWSGFGKLGVQMGLGVLLANGNGRFADPNMGTLLPKEQYTFVALPLNLGLVYRLELMNRQWVAPYAVAGGTYVGVVEFRDDGKTSMVGTPGAYGGGGLMFNISALNRETAFALKSEYGISNLWVAVDYRYLKTFSEDLDFSSSIIGASVVVDY